MMVATLVSTWLGVGKLPMAPGTWGSLAALPFAYGLHYTGGFWLLLIAVFVFFLIGLWASQVYMKQTATHDPGEIVVDEVVGMLVALLPISLSLELSGAPSHVFPFPDWILAFILFRTFDIYKPWPINWVDSRPDAIGVMLDDVLAGVYVIIALILLAIAEHMIMPGMS